MSDYSLSNEKIVVRKVFHLTHLKCWSELFLCLLICHITVFFCSSFLIGGAFQHLLCSIGGAHGSSWCWSHCQSMERALGVGYGWSSWFTIPPCRCFWCSSWVCNMAWSWPVYKFLGKLKMVIDPVKACLFYGSMFILFIKLSKITVMWPETPVQS